MERSQKDKVISRVAHISVYLLLAVGLVLASFYDLQLSKAIGDQTSFYGRFFAVYAEFPSYLVLPICSVIVFYNADLCPTRVASIWVKVLGVVLGLVGWFLFCYSSTKLVKIPDLLAFAITTSLMSEAASLAIGKLVPKKTMYLLLKFAVFAMVFAAIALAVMQGMKHLWCRMRYRDMLIEGNCDGFTPWYRIMAGREKLSPDYHYSSFPSGHSSSMTHIFLVCVLCDILPCMKKRWLRYTLNASFGVLTAIACFSRIVNCAHFLSDIIVGAGLTYLIFLICKKIFFGKGKYTFAVCDRAIAAERIGGRV